MGDYEERETLKNHFKNKLTVHRLRVKDKEDMKDPGVLLRALNSEPLNPNL
jgi:hypothetical protein